MWSGGVCSGAARDCVYGFCSDTTRNFELGVVLWKKVSAKR